MVYNIQIQSSSLGHCPLCNRHINTKALRFGSRLCFPVQARST